MQRVYSTSKPLKQEAQSHSTETYCLDQFCEWSASSATAKRHSWSVRNYTSWNCRTYVVAKSRRLDQSWVFTIGNTARNSHVLLAISLPATDIGRDEDRTSSQQQWVGVVYWIPCGTCSKCRLARWMALVLGEYSPVSSIVEQAVHGADACDHMMQKLWTAIPLLQEMCAGGVTHPYRAPDEESGRGGGAAISV